MKTTPATAPLSHANRALFGARPALSVRLQLALEEQQRLDRAARIKQLREESPYTQEAIADLVGVKIRSYQKWEEGGGIEWDNLEKLADIHKVSVQWIHRGEEKATPDVLGNLSSVPPELAAQLDRIEKEVLGLRTDLARLAQDVHARTSPTRKQRPPKPAAGK